MSSDFIFSSLKILLHARQAQSRVRAALKDAEFEKEEVKRDKKRKKDQTTDVGEGNKNEEPKTLPASDKAEKPPTKKQKSTPPVDEIFAPQNASTLDAGSVPNSFDAFDMLQTKHQKKRASPVLRCWQQFSVWSFRA